MALTQVGADVRGDDGVVLLFVHRFIISFLSGKLGGLARAADFGKT
jgi:hypothetical protein